MNIARAFNCSPSDAKCIAETSTAFHAAVHRLGPIRAWKRGKFWTLDGKRAEPGDFIREAQRLSLQPARPDFETEWRRKSQSKEAG